MDIIKRLPLDRDKRHFIVGDIHGRFETFLDLLAEADYNPDTDIIYSVGDLIDRGPKSFEAVEFFSTRENVYSIMGNHEYMAYEAWRWQNVWLRNGGFKCLESLEANGKDQRWLQDVVGEFPWIIEVGDDGEEGAFRIVHADVDWRLSDQEIHACVAMAIDEDGFFNGEAHEVQHFIWSRSTITKAMTNLSEMKPLTYNMEFNPDRKRHNFVGHTPIRKVTTTGDITHIDTWGSGTMSMVNALTREVFTVEMID